MPQHTATQHWKQEIASLIYKVKRLKSGKKLPSARQIYNWTYHKKQDLITDPRWFSAFVYDICDEYGVELEITPDTFMSEFDAICVKYFKWLSEELSDVGLVSRCEVYQKLDVLLANSPIQCAIETDQKPTCMPITASRNDGFISIWWYTDDGEFWDYSTTTDDAVEFHGFLQYSNDVNHMTLWYKTVQKFVSDPNERSKLLDSGYRSIERGRVVFNIRTMCYEVVCSEALSKDTDFRQRCISHFNLSGSRYMFTVDSHYKKECLSGNPALDSFYYNGY